MDTRALSEFQINKKNGNTYQIINAHIIDATNATDGRIMVLYKPVDKDQLFVRDLEEFRVKFENKEVER